MTTYSEQDAKRILRTAYLKAYLNGLSEISLKANDLQRTVPQIEAIFEVYALDDGDLFIKAPVLETYSGYHNFLFNTFINGMLGTLNYKYDTIVLTCTQVFAMVWSHYRRF